MPIQLNALTLIVEVTSPTTTVTVQELVNACREWEDDLVNMSYPKVIDAVGKTDLGGSVYTAITMTLSAVWQIQFWNGVTVGFVKDGTLVGGVGGFPIKATGGTDTIIINNQVGGTIALSGGSAPTAEQIRIEIDTNSTRLSAIEEDTGTTLDGKIDDVKAKTDTIDWDDIDMLVDESGGKWSITGNQMIFYKSDNITEIMRFNLTDATGTPTMTNVFTRERV